MLRCLKMSNDMPANSDFNAIDTSAAVDDDERVMTLACALVWHRNNEHDTYHNWLDSMIEVNRDSLHDMISLLMDAAVAIERNDTDGKLTEFVNSDRHKQIFSQMMQVN